MLVKDLIHQHILKKLDEAHVWFDQKIKTYAHPIYSSYDIRDSGQKISNVDANIFPAGFNNICPADKETSQDLMKEYISTHYQNVQNIVLVTEEHTNNAYYWENVWTIKNLIEASGCRVVLAIPRVLESPLEVTSSVGNKMTVYSAFPQDDMIGGTKPDLIISNNDFSEQYSEWAQVVADVPMNPAHELGWYQRKKSSYFKYYNQLVEEFSAVVGIDPFLLKVETELFKGFDIGSEESRNALASRVNAMLEKLKVEYKERGWEQEPFVFVKNNAGTYGLAVIKVTSGEEVKSWSYKSRKKMKAAKGGRDVEEVIIQEGIPSIVESEGASAEPVIYMIGSCLAGGFLRTHAEKGSTESLNSPGAVYRRLCVSDLEVDASVCPQENVYGWSARLGLLAIAMEAQELKARFLGYQV